MIRSRFDVSWSENHQAAFLVRSLTYLRTVGSKLGAREEDGRVVIPPYLFTGSKGVAVFDHGELVAELPPGTSIDLSITLPHPGRYKIDVSTNAPGSLRLGARSNGGAIDPSGEFDSSTPRATLALSVSQRLVLRGVALTPVP